MTKPIVEIVVSEAREYSISQLREAGYCVIVVVALGSIRVHGSTDQPEIVG